MAYRFDPEKEKLVKIANRQALETTPNIITINSVNFDEHSRLCKINYTRKIGKRTIKKTFTYYGQKYKIYNPWTYTTINDYKEVILFNLTIEHLNTETDEVICKAIPQILKALPTNLYPSWKRQELKNQDLTKSIGEKRAAINNKYKIIDKFKENLGRKTDENRGVSLEIARLNDAIQNLQNKVNENKKQITKYENSFLVRIFTLPKTHKSRKEEVEKLEESIKDKKVELENLRKRDMILTNEINNLNADINKLNADWGKEKAELDKWITAQKNIIKIAERPLSPTKKLQISPSTKMNLSNGSTPDEDWINEERNKMKRIYKDGLKLREWILERDNYTCKKCGISKKSEPHLLLEVDHIVPVSKWGRSVPQNLQTLCWSCNRSKGDKS